VRRCIAFTGAGLVSAYRERKICLSQITASASVAHRLLVRGWACFWTRLSVEFPGEFATQGERKAIHLPATWPHCAAQGR
jgi:hypothetical protein